MDVASHKYHKKTAVILLNILLAAASWGCSDKETAQLSGYIRELQEEYVDNILSSQDVQQTQEPAEETYVEAAGLEQPEIYYAYHMLTKDEQRVYLELLRALQEMQADVKVSTLDTDELHKVFNYVMADHPELFYVEGYQYTKYTTDDILTELTFTGTYTMAKEDMHLILQQIEAAAGELLAPLEGISDQYTIIRYLYDSLINATEYDSSVENNQNIQSVFLEKRSVCQGYAKAMQYLLQKEGIQTALVTGYANAEGHAWNLILADGEYYYLDATWGDASYSLNEAYDSSIRIPSINYDYFLVTTQELLKTHEPDEAMPLPQCTATADNYYVREGLYFDSYDADRLLLLFENGQSSGLGLVTLKCSDEAVYEQIKTRLIDEQEVFHFLHENGNAVSYTMNDSQLTISFWL